MSSFLDSSYRVVWLPIVCLNTILCTMDHRNSNYTCCLVLLISTKRDVQCTDCTIVDLKCDLVYSNL